MTSENYLCLSVDVCLFVRCKLVAKVDCLEYAVQNVAGIKHTSIESAATKAMNQYQGGRLVNYSSIHCPSHFESDVQMDSPRVYCTVKLA